MERYFLILMVYFFLSLMLIAPLLAPGAVTVIVALTNI